MSTFKGDFLGFTYNGKHSSEFGIVRVSNGDRYTKHLSPSFKLQTVDVPGADGVYYFGKKFNQKVFDISFSFDDVTEQQIREMQQWFNSRKIHELIFDEEPYKVWDVQISDQPNIKFVCFDDEYGVAEEISNIYTETYLRGGRRIYKGEGTVKFICYAPHAHTPKNGGKYLDYYSEEKYPTLHQWEEESGLVHKKAIYDSDYLEGEIDTFYEHEQGQVCNTYNGGDKPCAFKLKILNGYNESNTRGIEYIDIELDTYIKMRVPMTDEIYGIEIDSAAQLIYTLNDKNQRTGIVAPISGEFFKLDLGYCGLLVKHNSASSFDCSIEYDYLYY